MDRGSTKRGRPSASEREARREVILRAAVAEFLAHGFGGASIEAVASAAGVTKRTIYTHFDDKTGLYGAAVERQHGYIREPQAGERSLRAAAGAVVASLHSDTAVGLHRLVLAEAHRFPEIAAAFYARGPERSIGFLAEAIAAEVPGADPGSPGADPQAAAGQLYSLLLGEPHRLRLLGLRAAPSAGWAEEHALVALAALGLSNGR